MIELEKQKIRLMAIREAIANMNLESDFDDIYDNDELINEVYEKIKKIGDNNEKLGRLCS